MPTLDQVLNIVIPIGIIFFLFSLFYSKFKPSFDIMFMWMARAFSKLTQLGGGRATEYSQIVYR